jgi:hypothetical protein
MGEIRDLFKRIGVLGGTANTISNAGQRLLDLRNEFNKIGVKTKSKQ